MPVAGELLLSISNMADYNDRQDLLEWLVDTVKVRRIREYVPSDISHAIERVKNVDRRLDPVDLQIVACAVEAKARNLVTLDAKLIKNQRVQRSFRLLMVHPSSLV